MIPSTYRMWANLQELQNLPESDAYLFHNYPWKKHPAFENIMELEEENFQEAMAIAHEFWHVRFDIPSFKKSWS